MTAGPAPPNPVALLDSLKMKQLVGEWRRVYDYVLIDTPPIGAFADAQSLGDRADSTIWVVGIGRVTRDEIHRTIECLRGCGVAGFVANFTNRSHGSYGYTARSYYTYKPIKENQNVLRNENKVWKLFDSFRRHEI
jgi:Mrp family chromosome partitioning ATPase